MLENIPYRMGALRQALRDKVYDKHICIRYCL